MASKLARVWALDIGNNSLKALHLSTERGIVEVIGFDYIQHGKVLTGVGVMPDEKEELIALSLRKLVEKHYFGKEAVAVSMPSQTSFARFVNLPPVEPKRIPEIVKFEAAQQIPFDINEVQWDWQVMTETGRPETRVGIFAIKNEVINSVLEHLRREDISTQFVQMAPMALYNFVLYDRAELTGSPNQTVVVLDIGAESTDLVVCNSAAVWQRCIPIGGNAFTRAIAEAFKLNFPRAEKLKRTAPVSKYSRQILQAMRPVFTDLASEVQRSLSFYTSSNPDTRLVKVVAFGGGTRMRGLLKYLWQTLQIPVERPDSFKKLAVGAGVSATELHEYVADFGVVCGLALQGLELGKIESNLLPGRIARSMLWVGKAKHFTAAAFLLLLVSLMAFARTSLDRVKYRKNTELRTQSKTVLNEARQAENKLSQAAGKEEIYKAQIKKAFAPFDYREVAPRLYKTVISALPNEKNTPEQARLYRAVQAGDVETVKQIPRKDRKMIFITNMSVKFVPDIEEASLEQSDILTGVGTRFKGGGKGFDERAMRERMALGGAPSRWEKREYTPAAGTAGPQARGGFLVTLAGYSPYENIGALIEPAGVADDPDRWGFVTRLASLDPNGPFQLYERTPKHYSFDKGEVDLSDRTKMPAGIGVLDSRTRKSGSTIAGFAEAAEEVLIDPMTEEIISKAVEVGDDGKEKIDPVSGRPVQRVNDRWFILKLKFVWNGAPNEKYVEAQTPEF